MLPKSYVDGFLVEWEEGGYRAEVRMLRAESKALAVPTLGQGGASESLSKRADMVRARLDRTVRRVPEVVVKISDNPCKGMKQIARYIDYISRKGLLDIEDQDGCVLQGKADLVDLKEEWRYSGLDILEDVSERRDTLNVILSMPALTDELALKRAVRAFASREFENHQYVFGYHTPTTDPDENPPEHPHVHLVVRMQGRDGTRLNPRKADLRRWRETFPFFCLSSPQWSRFYSQRFVIIARVIRVSG